MNRWVALAVLGVLSMGLLAASPASESTPAKPPEKGLSKNAPKGEAQPLGRNVRLTFAVKGSELPPLSVMTASTNYGIEVQLAGGKGLTHVDISGEVATVEGARDRLLVHYRISIGHDGTENAISLYGYGSANVVIGTTTTLLDVAGKPLSVEVAEVK